MKIKAAHGMLALMLLGILGNAGVVFAHGGYGIEGGYGRYADNGIRWEIEQVLESGSYSELEEMRQRYQVPIMQWVESEEDFKVARQMHKWFWGEPGYGLNVYSNMPCHGWR